MSAEEILQLHPLLADRTRLALMVAIGSSGEDEVDFSFLKDSLDLTKGNLSSHLRKLEDGGLVLVKKKFVGRRPKTTYVCTPGGREALEKYLVQVEKILRSTLGSMNSGKE